MVIQNFFLPDVIEGEAFHDLMASFMKLTAKNKNTTAMPVRTIGMILIMLNIGRLGSKYDFYLSLSQENVVA